MRNKVAAIITIFLLTLTLLTGVVVHTQTSKLLTKTEERLTTTEKELQVTQASKVYTETKLKRLEEELDTVTDNLSISLSRVSNLESTNYHLESTNYQLTQKVDRLNSEAAQISSELAKLRTKYPPRRFRDASELEDWLSEQPNTPVSSDAILWLSHGLELQEKAAEDGYIISVELSSTGNNLYVTYCSAALQDNSYYFWDPETDEIYYWLDTRHF